MKFKLSELASVAEIIGAVAIIVSLIYVGVQVNDSTRSVRSATANETFAALSSWYSELGNNRESSEIFYHGMTDPDSLTPEELFQFVMNVNGIFLQYQAVYYLSQEGTLDVELRDSIINTMLGLREQPGFLLYWGQRGNLFKADFRRAIDEILDSGITNLDVERIYQSRESEQTVER